MKFALTIHRALTLATALVALNITGFALGRHERAQSAEAIRVEGLHARVEIVRDRHGVPHIRAKNETDAHFGLGFVHAQERLWQMEFQRRLGNGRLAEILGEKGLPTDRLFRTLGLSRTAAAAWARFDAEERRPFEDAAWCDDVRTPAAETCADTLASSLAEGLAKMNVAQGTDDMAAWRWDRAHHALFPHAPFDANPQLKPVFSRSIPNGGDKFTVNVASIFLWADYNQAHAAMYRQIVDFADLENSRFIVAPGQSGDPESPHYDDLLGRWQRVEYLPMRFDRKAFDGAAHERLVLEP